MNAGSMARGLFGQIFAGQFVEFGRSDQMETDLERGETPQIILHFVGWQLRTSDEQAACDDLVRNHFPTFRNFGRKRASDRTGDAVGFGFAERPPAKSRSEKSIIRAHGGETVDPGSPEHANGNTEREPGAVNAAAQAGA